MQGSDSRNVNDGKRDHEKVEIRSELNGLRQDSLARGHRDLPDVVDPEMGLEQGPNLENGKGASLDRRGSDRILDHKNHQEKPSLAQMFGPLMEDHARFLINFVMTFQMNSQTKGNNPVPMLDMTVVKPMLETRQFKSHTMDNVRIRKICDVSFHSTNRREYMKSWALRSANLKIELDISPSLHAVACT